jgi:hypothetical protein
VFVAIAFQVRTTEEDTDQSEATLAVVDEHVSQVGTMSAAVVLELTMVAIATHQTVPPE